MNLLQIFYLNQFSVSKFNKVSLIVINAHVREFALWVVVEFDFEFNLLF